MPVAVDADAYEDENADSNIGQQYRDRHRAGNDKEARHTLVLEQILGTI